MATTPFATVRRFAGFAITLLFCLWLSGNAAGQNAPPLVTASSARGLDHSTGSTWGAIQQTAIDSSGNWLVVDTANSALYEFPAGGGAAIVLAAPGALGGGYSNPGIAIDPGNNLYLEANWNNCLLMFPWDPVAKTWTGLSTMTPSNANTALCTNSGTGNSPYAWAQYGLAADAAVGFAGWYQPWAIAIGNNNNLIVGTQTNGQFIFSLPVTGWTNPKPATITWQPITGLAKRPISVAQDQAGNIYFVEDSGGLPGVLEVPVGTPNGKLTSDAGLTRVDPNLPAVTGVVTDSKGNLYISDSKVGVVMVPNTTGVPDTANAVVITGVPAQGEVAFDWARNTLYVPTSQAQTNGAADVAQVNFGSAEFGSAAVGTAAASPANVVFGFNNSTTPSRFVIVQDGAAVPDFAITGGTCTTGTAYAANSSCVENVTFTPSSVGSVSARLLMQKADPQPKGGPDASDKITDFCGSGGILTLTAANKLVSGELVQFSASDKSDPLNPLDGLQFNVLAAGLSNAQFAIKSSDVTTCPATDNTNGATKATVTGYIYSTLSSITLHGIGMGANIQALPAQESTIGGSLSTPSQVAVDRGGNVYIADPGLAKVLMFPAGAGTSSAGLTVGTGLVSPTGVAVDGAGDLFIADNNNGVGTVYEIPYMAGGLNSETSQVTVVTGLGANLKLALDNLNNLYIADPSEGRVVKITNVGGSGPITLGQARTDLTTGFTAPSAVAVDHNGNLFVIDGANLFELSGVQSTPATLANNLDGATGLAIDPSGAVYITSTAGTMRIPRVGGALDTANQTALAPDITGTAAIALDRMGNAYLVQSAGGAVTLVSISGALVLPTPADLTSSSSATATIINTGNAPLVVKGYTNSTTKVDTVTLADFTGADGTCVNDSTSPGTGIPAGGTCTASVIFNPQAGEEGNLAGWVGITSNAVNSPIVISTSAVGLPLAASATAFKVDGSAEVVNAPLTVTLTSKSGKGVAPSGQVAISFSSWNAKVPDPCGDKSKGQPDCVPAIYPITNTVLGTLDAKGQVTLQLAPVMAGNQAFTVSYVGDRVYGRSTFTQSAVVAKSSITGITLPTIPDPSDINLPFIPANTGNGTVPYDGTETPWQYQFKMSVNTLAGVPTGPLTIMDDSSTCPPGTSAAGIGTATCALMNYKGVACPQSAGSGVLYPANAGTPAGAQAIFNADCLWNVPSGVTYSPVIYTHYIHPEYGGDANFNAYVGPTPTLFQAVRGPLVQITKTGDASTLTKAPTLTVSAGSSASIDLTISSILGYGRAGNGGSLNNSNFPVSLTCDMPLPHAACAITYDNSIVDPNQITVPNSVQVPCPANAATTDIASGAISCTPGHATVTVYTNVAVGTTTSQNAGVASVTLAALFGFGMFGLFFRRRSFEKQRMLLMVLLIVVSGALAVALTACSTTNLSPQTQLKTPAGTYQMTITAQPVGSQCIASVAAGSNCTTSSGGYGVYVYGSENQVSLPFYVNVKVQ